MEGRLGHASMMLFLWKCISKTNYIKNYLKAMDDRHMILECPKRLSIDFEVFFGGFFFCLYISIETSSY